MPDAQARGPAGEAAIGDERALRAEPGALEVGGRVEHLLHAGSALRALVADDDDVALLDLLREDHLDGLLLGLGDPRRTGEVPLVLGHAGGLDDAAVGGEVAREDRQSPFARVGVLDGTDATVLGVGVEAGPSVRRGEGLGRAHATRGGVEELLGPVGGGAGADVPVGEPLVELRAVHGADAGVEHAAPMELTEDRRDAPGAVDVLHVEVGAVRRHLDEARRHPGEGVDVVLVEVDARLLRRGEQVEDRVGRAAHGDVQPHGIGEGGAAGDRARQHRVVVTLVVVTAQVDDEATRVEEEVAARLGRGQGGAVAGKGEAEGLGEAVHRVGGEHARAGAARRAGGLLDGGHLVVGDGVVDGLDHGVDEVEPGVGLALLADDRLAGLHRAAGDEDRGDVEAQGGEEHPRRDLVAVGDAHEGIRAVRLDHVLDRVGDDLSARERVEHPGVAHGDAVVDGDGVELLADPAGLLDGAGDELAHVLEVDVTGHELGEGVGDRDDRLAEVPLAHARGAPEGAGSGHVATVGGGSGTQLRHTPTVVRRSAD